jgi:DNA-binding CsgD family transcriptional regulator
MLSDQERIVLRLIASGYTRGQIAILLGNLSLFTVDEYCRRVFQKLGAASSPHAVALGIKSQQINVEEIASFAPLVPVSSD